MKKPIFKLIAAGLVILFIIIQFFWTDKNNSTVIPVNAIENHYNVPSDIRGLLKTSCYDCHSNNTTYPWYNTIQPVKWWLSGHIKEGKEHLNFDEFNSYPVQKKLHKLDEVVETINNDEMPLSSYTMIHRKARLSDADKKEIASWVDRVKKEIQ